MWISSLKYAGVDVARTLCAMTAVLYVHSQDASADKWRSELCQVI